jgi:DNA-binding NarL/FixJ family response regulator
LAKELSPVEILEASNAEDAVALCRSRTLDLVLMDFHLPDMNGIEATERIKIDSPDLPIVILTVQENDHYIDKAISSGADAYVVKQQMYTDLIPAIENALQSKGRTRT